MQDDANVPITARSPTGQAVKSARHQPKALAQMKPNLLGSEYATQDDASAGYASAFRSNAYASRPEQNAYRSGQPTEDPSRSYPSEIPMARDYQVNQSLSSAYAAENQIKFQGDLGDDMFPPNTDDDESQEDRKEEEGAPYTRHSPVKEHDWVKLSEKEDDTPQIMSNHRKQAANINPNAFQSRESQKRATQASDLNLITINEMSELEVTQTYIPLDQSERERAQRPSKHQDRDAQNTDSDAASAHALYHP